MRIPAIIHNQLMLPPLRPREKIQFEVRIHSDMPKYPVSTVQVVHFEFDKSVSARKVGFRGNPVFNIRYSSVIQKKMMSMVPVSLPNFCRTKAKKRNGNENATASAVDLGSEAISKRVEQKKAMVRESRISSVFSQMVSSEA